MSGITPDGRIFTTARYRPRWEDREYLLNGDTAQVTVYGAINDTYTEQNNALPGDFQFVRRFLIEPRGVTVESSFSSSDMNQAVELYETIPLFIRDAARQRNAPYHKIWFLSNGVWVEVDTTTPYENVQQVKVERFNGAVRILFETPQRVLLSDVWVDGFQSGATCRNVMIDLLRNDGVPVTLPSQFTLRYRIVPAYKSDINEDGCVDDADLSRVLFAFGQTGADLPEDLNRDGIVDDGDVSIVLMEFTKGC